MPVEHDTNFKVRGVVGSEVTGGPRVQSGCLGRSRRYLELSRRQLALLAHFDGYVQTQVCRPGSGICDLR